MKRLTQKTEAGWEICPGQEKAAIERLAALEELYLKEKQLKQEIEREMERLHSQGKERTVRFREMMVQKMQSEELLRRLTGIMDKK